MATLNLTMKFKKTGWFYLLLCMEYTNICPVWLIRFIEHKPVVRISIAETTITLTLADCHKDFKKPTVPTFAKGAVIYPKEPVYFGNINVGQSVNPEISAPADLMKRFVDKTPNKSAR